MIDQELIYMMAMTRLLPLASDKQRILLQELGSATAIYEQRYHLRDILSKSAWRVADALAGMDSELERCEMELHYARSHRIRVLALGDGDYPTRLAEAEDAPLVIYALGNADLNPRHVVSVVGTRRCTEYGRDMCRKMAADFARLLPGTLVVSGLAYGIDIAAHRACLESGLPTVGVLAHGLDQVYPRLHRQTAIDMLRQGGLLTEYMSYTRTDKLNFVQRNRIVAAMSDAIVIVESPSRGGSLITASLAFGYNRDVFAVPGRVGDACSEGCNMLIRKSQAQLVSSADDIIHAMRWETESTTAPPCQTELFPQLNADEAAVVDALRQAGTDLSLTMLGTTLQWPVSKIMSTTFALEMKGMLSMLPGNTYHLKG